MQELDSEELPALWTPHGQGLGELDACDSNLYWSPKVPENAILHASVPFVSIRLAPGVLPHRPLMAVMQC